MNRRQKIIISLTGIFLVLLILVGLTYAYFLTQIQGNEEEKSIIVTTANLVLEYGDGNGILETEKLEPSNDFIQFKDSQGNLVPSKIFTVTNKGNATVEGYKVYLEKVQNQLVRKDDLVYTLSCKAYTNYGETNQAESGTCTGVGTETTFPDVITSIVSNDIEVGVTHVYELKAKYKEMNVDQSIDMNKLITAKINIYDSTTKFLAREIIDNANAADTVTPFVDYAQLGTLENTTIPLKEASLESEHILSRTQDYYGTSYFYRGTVQNNYVLFNNLCWRIVRIEGDGSVKLALAGTPTNNKCENLSTTGGLIKEEDTVISAVYGYKIVDETRYLADYENNTLGKTDDYVGLYEVLTNWYDTNFDIEQKQRNVKQNTLWCLGGNDLIGYDPTTGESIDVSNSSDYYYSAGKRFYLTKIPSLMCGSDEDKVYSPIGTLTMDEIVLAGVESGATSEQNYYLYEQSQSQTGFSTLSLSIHSMFEDSILYVTTKGLLETAEVDYVYGVRPIISLKPSTKISDGIGLANNPFVIN